MPYSGFSTKNKKAINNVLTGNDLVIEDLMNEIMTRKGERIMFALHLVALFTIWYLSL